MTEVMILLGEIVAVRQRHYDRLRALADKGDESEDDADMAYIELLQAKVDLAREQEKHQ